MTKPEMKINTFAGCPAELLAYANGAHSNEIEVTKICTLAMPDVQGVSTQDGDIFMEFDGTFGILIRRNAAGQLETIARNDGGDNEVIG